MGTLEGIVGILRALKPLIWALAIIWVGKKTIEVYEERFNPNPAMRIKALPPSYIDVSTPLNYVLPEQNTEALALVRGRARLARR